MAAISSSPDQTAKMIEDLTLESDVKAYEVPEPEKKTSPDDKENEATGQFHCLERSSSPFFPDSFDPNMCFYPSSYHPPCFYGTYGARSNTWGNYPRSGNTGGTESSNISYANCGSAMYHGTYGYPAYGYQPTTHVGENNVGGNKQNSVKSVSEAPDSEKEDVTSTNSSNEKPAARKEYTSFVPFKPSHQLWNPPNSYGMVHGITHSKCYRKGQSGLTHKPKDNSQSKSNDHQNSSVMAYQYPEVFGGYNSAHSYMNRIYPNKFYGSYDLNLGYGYYGYNPLICGPGCFAMDSSRFKSPKGRTNSSSYNTGHEYLDERSRGPRFEKLRNQTILQPLATNDDSTTLHGTLDDKNADNALIPDRSQYNLPDFPVEYSCSRFFVIKSYSEDDIHKSIKYNVWSSTPNGNKKLNAAYNEAQQNSTPCPVYLLFSVNASGHFIGIAEMVGPVDFNKNVDYWQQDKWTGCFPVKWHILKDLSNNLLKHITLENNENKPVTNSRDTQEVMHPQGIEILKIFKNFTSKTCMLDDFPFYESREVVIREKKSQKNSLLHQDSEKPVVDKSASTVPENSDNSAELQRFGDVNISPISSDPVVS